MDVIILAGGKGTRMEGTVPKPLVIVRGKPIIERRIDYLLSQKNVGKIIISLGVSADLIQQHLAERYPTVPFVFAIEQSPLGTAGGLKHAMMHATSDRVVAMNGDDFLDIELDDFTKGDGHTLAVAHPRLPFGLVSERDGFAVFEEKPILASWVNAGWYCFDRKEIMPLLPNEGSLEYDVFPHIKLKMYRYEGIWYPLNSKKEVQTFEEAAL